MNEETIERLGSLSEYLHSRSRAHSLPGGNEDTASILSALATTMEAVRSIGETLNQMNDVRGPGKPGS
jgi:hypothetical protein